MQFDTINQKGNSASILTVDFLSVAFGECITQESLVIRQDLRIPMVAKALEERSGPLDIGEEEGDRSGRKASHESLRQPGRFASAYSIACSSVIARPSAQAAAKGSSPKPSRVVAQNVPGLHVPGAAL